MKNNVGNYDGIILYVCLEEGRRDEGKESIFLSGKLGDYVCGFAFDL